MDDDEIEDLFRAVGPVAIRRMFGGKGIYSEGRIIALLVGGELLLKVDSISAPDFESAGSRRWTYERADKAPVAMPYFKLPDDALDDPDIMADWARKARDAGHRAPRPTKAKSIRRRKHPAPDADPVG